MVFGQLLDPVLGLLPSDSLKYILFKIHKSSCQTEQIPVLLQIVVSQQHILTENESIFIAP